MPGAQAQRRGSPNKNTPWHVRGADEGGYASASDYVESGSCFPDFYELSLTREKERNRFQDSPELHSIMETFLTSYK